MTKRKKLIYVAGATATGKTALSIQLAKAFKTHILSCDSRQFYKEMYIGTAVPNPDELHEVPHHFIQHRSIKEHYSTWDYEQDALPLLEDLFKKNNTVIMTGGSGMYADAVMNGLDVFPDVPKTMRQELEDILEKKGIEALQKMLKEKDPLHYDHIDLQNPRRLIRALEICLATGNPYSYYLNKNKENRAFTSIVLNLTWERSKLYEKINQRVDEMVRRGLEKEAKRLHPMRHLNVLNTVGYKELFDYFEKKISYEKAIDEIKKNTRRYAKRQITWFRKYDNGITIMPNTSIATIVQQIHDAH